MASRQMCSRVTVLGLVATLFAACSSSAGSDRVVGDGNEVEIGAGAEAEVRDERPSEDVSPTVELRVVPLEAGGLDLARADHDDVLTDSGSTSTILLMDDDPVWIGLHDDGAAAVPLAEIAPEQLARTSSGFNNLAACGPTVVMVLDDPPALVAVDTATGSQRWELVVDDPPQIACGDADVVVAQFDSTIVGLEVDDGAARWSQPIEPDDPLRLTPTQGLIGSYDGVISLDLATGERLWTLGTSTDSVVAPSPAGSLLRLGDGYAVIDNEGSVVFELTDDEVGRDPWRMFVAQSGDTLALVDPEDASVIGPTGSRSLVDLGVVRILGPGPAGLIWAITTGDRGHAVELLDAQGEVAATSDLDTGAGVGLPGVALLVDRHDAIVVS